MTADSGERQEGPDSGGQDEHELKLATAAPIVALLLCLPLPSFAIVCSATSKRLNCWPQVVSERQSHTHTPFSPTRTHTHRKRPRTHARTPPLPGQTSAAASLASPNGNRDGLSSLPPPQVLLVPY